MKEKKDMDCVKNNKTFIKMSEICEKYNFTLEYAYNEYYGYFDITGICIEDEYNTILKMHSNINDGIEVMFNGFEEHFFDKFKISGTFIYQMYFSHFVVEILPRIISVKEMIYELRNLNFKTLYTFNIVNE